MRSLVIDDSRATRAVLRRLLATLGFHDVAEAGDGRAALDWLDANGPVDLALVDWNMPVLDGLGVVRAVRTRPDYDRMRLVMVTTESDAQHMLAALEAGADDYAMKPFTADVIREKLQLLDLVG